MIAEGPRPQENHDDAGEPEVYALDCNEPAAPPLPGKVSVALTADEALDAVAADMVTHAINCIRSFGDFHLVLSGDAAMEPLYKRLMYDPNYRGLPWKRTHLWLLSEHAADIHANTSGYAVVRDTIVDHSDIPPDQVHPMLLDEGPGGYEQELVEALSWREKGQDRLDCVLTSVDDMGNVGLLHPGAAALDATNFVAPSGAGMTLTLATLNATRFLGVLMTGSAHAPLVAQLDRSSSERSACVAGRLEPLNGELHWYLDVAACGGTPSCMDNS